MMSAEQQHPNNTPPRTPDQIVKALLRRRDGVSLAAARLITELQNQLLKSAESQQH